MNNSIIDKIDKIIKDHENKVLETLDTIKALIASERELDFSKIKDGEHFAYKGIEFVRLGEEQGGILCVTAKIWKRLPFNENNHNNFRNASIRKALNDEFLPLLNNSDLLPYKMDLTADNGDKEYGSVRVYVGLLSADLYRKYRDCIPSYNDWVWLCTPWYCYGFASVVRHVRTDGLLSDIDVCGTYGVVPAVIFKETK